MEQEKGQYRVVLKSIGNNTKEEVEEFCQKISKNLNLPSSLIKKIAHRNPIVLKKNLTLKKAETLAIAFKSFGANVVIEKRISSPTIQVERQGLPPPKLALETCSLRKTPEKNWLLVGRVKNISQEPLKDIWVIIQLFNLNELITFEEVSLPINPILPNQLSPFKALLEGDLEFQKISLLFKNLEGTSYFVLDQRKRREWEEIEIPESVLKMKPFREEETVEKVPFTPERETIQGEERIGPEGMAPYEEEKKESESLVLDVSGSSEELESKGSISEERLELVEEEKGTSSPYPWIEEFRAAIETYYQPKKDGFSLWIKNLQTENLIESPYHLLVVFLTYSRFNQKDEDEKALENTQKVFPLLLRSDLTLDEIPEMEAPPFFSREVWRVLFFRALPKIQEVAKEMLEKREWKAEELEQFIQIIPQMGLNNSRWVVRRIPKWILEDIQVDFTNTSVSIGEGLYRVASRLGIVNPQFDLYRGKNSMGDLKIQSFAKMVFPDNPMRIEEPMEKLGREEEEGHCFPIDPKCLGCLFESFCPKFYTEINPSEKGMIG